VRVCFIQLLDAAAGYRFEAAVVLALAYGMRRGEVHRAHMSYADAVTPDDTPEAA
jgi:hypothetical protein